MKILFVCLGNICRSPAADGVFSNFIEENNLAGTLSCDSCGTGDWHIGQLPDERMRAAGALRGYNFTHRARQLCSRDFIEFDLILAMDSENVRDILACAPKGFDRSRVKLFTDFCDGKFASHKFVPDPYFGGKEGFELVLDIIENGCAKLLSSVR